MRELLNAQGFTTAKISVDRSEEPYKGLRNILRDQRIELINNDIRDTELIKLQRMNGRIDHPMNGSKDIADCLCGACWQHVLEHTKSPASNKSIANAISSVNSIGNQSKPSVLKTPIVLR